MGVDHWMESEKASHIYIMSAGSEGPSKIGVSKKPKRRLATLRTASPVKVTLWRSLRVGPGIARSIEREAHRLLVDFRTNGEWFSVPPGDAFFLVNFLFEGQSDLAQTIVDRCKAARDDDMPELKRTCTILLAHNALTNPWDKLFTRDPPWRST